MIQGGRTMTPIEVNTQVDRSVEQSRAIARLPKNPRQSKLRELYSRIEENKTEFYYHKTVTLKPYIKEPFIGLRPMSLIPFGQGLVDLLMLPKL